MSTNKRSKMKIVHLTTVHHPYDPRIFYKQCQSLKEAGFDVTLIAQALENGDLVEGDVKHIPLKKHTSRLKRMLFSPFELYKKAKKEKADIYVFHDPELLFVGSLLKKRDNIVVYDIHEDYVTSILQKKYLHPFIRQLAAKSYRFIEKLTTRKMALSLAEKYYQDIYPNGKCILNYPIIPEVDLQVDESKVKKDALLYTGNVTEDRGALYHAKIPTIDEKVDVQLIGKCPQTLADHMYDIAQDHKERLHIKGIDAFIPKYEIDAAYQETKWLAGIAIFPPTEHYMKKELTKFFEYMANGLPIICSNFPVWEAFIEQYECGLTVDPEDDQSIHDAINYLREHEKERQQMSLNGMKAVNEELNWRKEAEKLINWYEQLIKERDK